MKVYGHNHHSLRLQDTLHGFGGTPFQHIPQRTHYCNIHYNTPDITLYTHMTHDKGAFSASSLSLLCLCLIPPLHTTQDKGAFSVSSLSLSRPTFAHDTRQGCLICLFYVFSVSSLSLSHPTFEASRCRGREARGGVTVSFGNSSSIVAMISLESLMNEPSGSWRGVVE